MSVLGLRKFKDTPDFSIASATENGYVTFNLSFTFEAESEGVTYSFEGEMMQILSLEGVTQAIFYYGTNFTPENENIDFQDGISPYMSGEWSFGQVINITSCDDEAAEAWLLANTDAIETEEETEAEISLESIKTKMQVLIDKSNAKTGKSDTDLYSAFESLLALITS